MTKFLLFVVICAVVAAIILGWSIVVNGALSPSSLQQPQHETDSQLKSLDAHVLILDIFQKSVPQSNITNEDENKCLLCWCELFKIFGLLK